MTSLTRRKDDSLEAPQPLPIRALIAEDDPPYRAYLGALARRLGLETESAADGEGALAKLRGGCFEMLLSDYEMPRRDGLELIRAVRADPAISSVYAVMLTGHEEVVLKIEALTAGYDDFLHKNCTEVELMAKVTSARRMLSRQRALDQAVREWQGIASHDELTGVFTRRMFFEEAARMFAESRAVGVVLFDLDAFKQINDTFGHLTGDRILRDVGMLLLERTRHCDVIARFGGDEFVMLVTDLPLDGLHAVARRIADDIHALEWTIGETTLRVHATTGTGLSTMIPDATIDQILEVADRDLYANKWLARNPSATPHDLYQYHRDRAAEVVRLDEEGREGLRRKG